MTGPSRLNRILHRSWDTLGLAVLVSGFLAASFPLSRIAAWIPRSVLSVTLVLIVIQLLLEIRAPLHETRGEPAATAAPSPDPALALGATPPGLALLWLGGLLLAVLMLGTTAGSMVFCFAYLRWHARASRSASSGLALALGAGVQLIFGMLLQVSLYPGWLWLLVH